MNFTDYLIYVKSQLNNLVKFRLIRIVLGNEACDLDSAISACVYAYFLHSTCQSKDEILHVPILNTQPSVFRLRNEIHWLLKENHSNMIFIDDIDLNYLYDKNKLEIILVDHHCLYSKFNKIVTQIIDHHPLKENSIALQDSSKIKIELVGSCCTLIAEEILTSNTNFQMTNEIAYLLTGPILFDTFNFSPSAGRTTEKDKQIYEQLLTYRTLPVDDSTLFKDLKQCASTTTGMSVQDLLQKDVKQVSGPNIRLVISSLPSEYTVEKLIGQLKTMKDIDEFLSNNDNADGVIMLSLETTNDETKRQLGFYIKKYEHMLPINEYIQRGEHNLNLRERGIPINQARIKLFEQRNVQASRKQILPLIENFAKDFAPQNSS
ncbi:unnamed protein product [Rotaria sordida]|uniref:DHHA2 domain-containing protein n=2 Tax=Rotaria sordida TaxID=392033 RepID=A0A814V4M9_9BILA|nr:unnamed protein product [Rotaria sordida]CAF1184218.1 unnamed protein product [Rotaria sordida]CAF1277900.1 unnamed protein product [Rotaria sordida]CAF1557313.1 unnamed protein product [Rotaria sordida]CAF3511806.1 unnamed protein product [Rotaria sordida]